jgi:hypothetical protein
LDQRIQHPRRLGAARKAVLKKLAGVREFSTKELRESLSELSGQVSRFEHKPYAMVQHIAPQVLAWMGATGDLVRGHNGSHWQRQPDPVGADGQLAR